MLITTTEQIPGHDIVELLGVVQGSTVRAKHMGKDILSGFKNIVGGEIKAYTKLLNEARQEALQRLQQASADLGADAVINLRFITSSVMQGASEILVYGTAVKLAPKAS